MSEILAVSDDGTIEFQQLTAKYLEEALKIMPEAFFFHENVCKGIGLPSDPEAITELLQLTRNAAQDGVSVIAINRETNKVVGASFNKLQVNGPSEEESYFEKFAKSCKQPLAKAVVEFMLNFDNICNLFEYCQVDCILEIMFVGTLPECRRKGIGKKLCELSLEIGSKLANGENVKKSVDGTELSLKPTPKIASAIFTSLYTQKIGRKLGFEIAAEKSYDLLEHNGKSISSIIGKETPTVTLEYKKLTI